MACKTFHIFFTVCFPFNSSHDAFVLITGLGDFLDLPQVDFFFLLDLDGETNKPEKNYWKGLLESLVIFD